MTGDQGDFVSRLKLTLPAGWFEDEAPVLAGLLSGLSSAWSSLYALLQAVRVESRIAGVTDRFLDLACVDFFGAGLSRRSGETDAALRGRFRLALSRLRGTRASLIDAARQAGYSASVFEPARLTDTGAYSTPGGLAWGSAGGWGSLQMPLECFVSLSPIVPVADPATEVAVALPAGGLAWIRVLG